MSTKLQRYGRVATVLVAAAVCMSVCSTAVRAAVEEITVTTRKRAEDIQKVPISVSAISADQIERLLIRDVRDVAKITPSLVFDTGFDQRDTRIVIRGLVPTRGRQDAAFLIDGIDVTSETINAAGGSLLATRRLLDVERVEVVKGPQSALYGRSAFNGAVQYITHRPSLTELEMKAAFDVGTDERYGASASVSGPVVNGVLGLGLSAQGYSNNGFYNASNNNQDLGGENGWAVAGSALWQATPQVSVAARVDYAHDNFDPIPQVWVLPNLVGVTAASLVPSSAGIVSGSPQYLFFGEVPDASELRSPTHPDNPFTGSPYDGAERDIFRASLIASWDADWGTVTSWTGYAASNATNNQDGNNGEGVFSGPPGAQTDVAMNISYRNIDTDTTMFSEELRYESKLDGPIQFTVGALYWESKDDQTNHNLSRSSCTSSQAACAAMSGAEALLSTVNPFVDNDIWSRDVNHASAYGLVEWKFIPTWTFTAEARYSYEEERVTGSVCADSAYFFENGIIDENSPINQLRASLGLAPRIVTSQSSIGSSSLGTCPFGPSSIVQGPAPDFITYKGLGAAFTQTFYDNFVTPRFTLQWQPSEDTNIYLSAAEGIKPGGTSTVTAGPWFDSNFDNNVNEVTFSEEKLWSYELGLKRLWLDKSLVTNIAAFYQDYTDKQVGTQVITPSGQSTGKISNAGAARLWGLEFEDAWRPSENWTLTANYTYLNTEYTDFKFLTTSAAAVIRGGNCTPTPVFNPATNTTSNQCTVDQSGHPLERAPKHSAYLEVAWEHPLPNTGLNFITGADGRYLGTRTVDPSARITLPPSWITDARIGLNTDSWEVALFCTNCLDSDKVISALDSSNVVTSELLSNGASSASGSLALANLPDPRVWGVRGNIRFGK